MTIPPDLSLPKVSDERLETLREAYLYVGYHHLHKERRTSDLEHASLIQELQRYRATEKGGTKNG